MVGFSDITAGGSDADMDEFFDFDAASIPIEHTDHQSANAEGTEGGQSVKLQSATPGRKNSGPLSCGSIGVLGCEGQDTHVTLSHYCSEPTGLKTFDPRELDETAADRVYIDNKLGPLQADGPYDDDPVPTLSYAPEVPGYPPASVTPSFAHFLARTSDVVPGPHQVVASIEHPGVRGNPNAAGTTSDLLQPVGAILVGQTITSRENHPRVLCRCACGCKHSYYQRKVETYICVVCKRRESCAVMLQSRPSNLPGVVVQPSAKVFDFNTNMHQSMGLNLDANKTMSLDSLAAAPADRLALQPHAASEQASIHANSPSDASVAADSDLREYLPTNKSAVLATPPSAANKNDHSSITVPDVDMARRSCPRKANSASKIETPASEQAHECEKQQVEGYAEQGEFVADDTEVWAEVGDASQAYHGIRCEVGVGEKVKLSIVVDNVHIAKGMEGTSELSREMFKQLLHDSADPPSTFTQAQQEKYSKGQDWAKRQIQEKLSTYKGYLNACRRIKILIDTVIRIHEEGIPIDDLSKDHYMIKSRYVVDHDSDCLSRIRLMISCVRDNKLVAKDVITEEVMIDFARAPVSYMKRKIDNVTYNERKELLQKAGKAAKQATMSPTPVASAGVGGPTTPANSSHAQQLSLGDQSASPDLAAVKSTNGSSGGQHTDDGNQPSQTTQGKKRKRVTATTNDGRPKKATKTANAEMSGDGSSDADTADTGPSTVFEIKKN